MLLKRLFFVLGCSLLTSGCSSLRDEQTASNAELPSAPVPVSYYLELHADCQRDDTWTQSCQAQFSENANAAAAALLDHVIGPGIANPGDADLQVSMIYSEQSKLFRSRGTVFMIVEDIESDDEIFFGLGHGYVHFSTGASPLDYATCHDTMERCMANVAPRLIRNLSAQELAHSELLPSVP